MTDLTDLEELRELIEVMIHHVLSKDPKRFVQISVLSDPIRILALDATGQVWVLSESDNEWYALGDKRNPNG